MSEQVLPFYLVCDESSSMTGNPIDEINKSLPNIHYEIGSNPVVADKTRFCLIGFSTSAQVLLPLADLSAISSMPTFQAGGSTSYGAAFDTLYDTITSDVATLKAEGNQVFRPAVFFLSDGQPTDTWADAYRRVADPHWTLHPNILAFGFGSVDEQTLQQVATVKAFIANGTMGPEHALREFAQSLIRSIVNSGTQSQDGRMTLVVPDSVPGFTTLDAEPI